MSNPVRTTLQPNWASHSFAERAFAYYRFRVFGSLALFISFLTTHIIYPSPDLIKALLIIGADIVVLAWQRRMIVKGDTWFFTIVSLMAASILGTIGLHLAGGFMTLRFGFYLILTLVTALVFWQRSAVLLMASVNCFLFLTLAITEITNIFPPNEASFVEIYNFQEHTSLITASIIFGIILIFIAMFISGSAAEKLGNWNITLSYEVDNKTRQLKSLLKDKKKTYRDIVSLLAHVIEARDQYTIDHSNRISLLASEIAKLLDYDEKAIEEVQLAAILHDVGKVGVPDDILNKPGPLTPAEREIMMRHPDIGADLISTIDELRDVAEIIRAHHERFDGGGYPQGLSGEGIPLTARIVCVVDSYTAMTDKRPYKKEKSKAFAIKELRVESGKQFDPQVVDAFLYVLQLEK